jgi:hypothetical protein
MNLYKKHPGSLLGKIAIITGIALLTTVLPSALHAQQTEETAGTEDTASAQTPKFAVSINAGLAFSYTDVKPSKSAPVFGIGGHYYAAPYLHVNLDVQAGTLKGGEEVDNKNTLAGFKNNFVYGSVTARFLPLALIDNKSKNEALAVLSNLYVGAGLGFIANKVETGKASPDFGPLGEYKGADFLFPAEVGFNIPVAQLKNNKRLFVNLNYRINLCFSDEIDGYVPLVDANKKNDAFNSLTAGLVFNF